MGKEFNPDVFNPAAWVLDNQQGLGEDSQPTGKISDGFGDIPQPDGEYVALVRREAAVAGIELPADDIAAVRLAARAAIEAQ